MFKEQALRVLQTQQRSKFINKEPWPGGGGEGYFGTFQR